ncbi:MAG: protein kinase [Polyangiaceae bacterium]|nr:protein kinase [Polyangiaceae bacterium]
MESPAGLDEELPEKVHEYRILGRLGRGGFADVYLACPPGSFRPLALKVLREQADERVREQVLSRFHTEEGITRAIDHPAIVKIRATSPPGVTPSFVAMEYVEALPFCEHFRRRGETLDLHEVASVAYQVAEAMAEAHRRGIVHRDLKPDNVLVTRGAPAEGGGRVKILDFGIAKAPLGLFATVHERAITRYITELGTVMGSPPYMAPEQNGAAHAVTGKADVFALGVMLLLVVCRTSESELCGPSHLLLQPEDVTRLLARSSGVPRRWVELLQDLLAFDPQHRPEMREVMRRLQRLGQSHEPFARAVEAWLAKGRVPSSRRLRALLKWAAQASALTPDEQRFLREAPAARLRRRWVGPAVLVGLPLLAATALFRSGMGQPSPWRPSVPPATAGFVLGPAAPAPLESAASVPAPSAAGSAPSAPWCASPEKLAAAERELGDCRASSRAVRADRDAVASRLAASRSSVADLEVDLAAAGTRLSALDRDLALSRETAAEQGKQAFACRQELESKNRQLDESMARWRLCARGMRGGAVSSNPRVPPPVEGTTESIPTPPTVPPSPAAPPES